MFRFDSFRSQSQATSTTNATREDSQAPPEDSKIKFLQRISSSDSIDKKSLTKRPSFSSMSSFSGRSGSSSSTIPVPSNSWGMLMLSTLRNDDMLEDVCSLLTKDQKVSYIYKRHKFRSKFLFVIFGAHIFNHRLPFSCLSRNLPILQLSLTGNLLKTISCYTKAPLT
jgi:hypothetical protein